MQTPEIGRAGEPSHYRETAAVEVLRRLAGVLRVLPFSCTPWVRGPLAYRRSENGVSPSSGAIRRRAALPRWLQRSLRLPLAGKLAGANALLVILVASLALLLLRGEQLTQVQLVEGITAALLVSLLVNLALVRLALLPLRGLEATASLVLHGDLGARVPPSLLADRDMTRIGGTINLLLDRLMADRTRIRRLAAQVIEAAERERARIAHELHDSTAQTLSALSLQATSALDSVSTPKLRGQLELIRDLAVDALEEVRMLSHTVHPRVLDDLGLVAALERLARRTREEQGTESTVEVLGNTAALPRPLGSVLYNVAAEAVSNTLRHADARSVEMALTVDGRVTRLDVIDDGRGFDPEEARLRRPGMGLFTMAERVALVDGTLEVDSTPGRGTRVTAIVPTTLREASGTTHDR